MATTKEKTDNFLASDINFGRVSLTQKAIFAKHLAIMLKAGLDISEALAIVVDASTGKFKKIIKEVLKSVASGESLANALGQYPQIFSGIFINSILVGESSGTLAENLENVATQLEKEKELRDKVTGAMLYPIVVLVAAAGLGAIIALVVLPKIVPLFQGLKVKLPLSTQILIWVSTVLQNYGLIIFICLAALLVVLVWLVRQKFTQPLTHWLILHTPLIGRMVRGFNLARVCRTLGMLLASGLNIDEALKITSETISNYYFRTSLANIYQRIGKGTTIAENLANYKKFYPVMVVKMVMVGERSGELEQTLFYLADFYEEEVDRLTKSLATAIEPLLLVVIGLVVAFLALAIITPMYSITSGMQ